MAKAARSTSGAALEAQMVAAARGQRVQLARTDLATFVEHVGRDERTGEPIVLAPYQEDLLRFVEQNPLCVVHSFIDSGKSFLISAMRTLFKLGNDASRRILVCSSAQGQAVRTVRTVMKYIEQSTELHEVFPHLKPGKPWRDDMIQVNRRAIGKDASVVATGVRGQVLGARADDIVLDDVDDRESTATEHTRRETLGWIRSTLLSRLTHGGSVVAVGTPWHPGDVLHTLATDSRWPMLRVGVLDEDGKSRWPARWPIERVEEMRKTMSIFEAARALDVEVRDDEAAVFHREWVEYALDRGRVRGEMLSHMFEQAGRFVIVGVDLAVARGPRADKTAIAVVVCHPHTGDRELVRLESARLSAPQILQRIVTINQWFRPLAVVVEDVAAQAYLTELLKVSTSVPVVGYTTGRGERSLKYQCELLASEMSRGKWVFDAPGHDEIKGLAHDLMFFTPSRHTPDRVAALCFARWGAEERSHRVERVMLDFSRR